MQFALAAVGAYAGFLVGGPQGAYVGASLGYSIGGAIETSNQKIVTEGPRLADLKVTLSSQGLFIPRVYVRGRISGNIIEATDLKASEVVTETESPGKGGPTQVYKATVYSSTFRVMVCKSNGDRKVAEILANGKLIWSRSPTVEAAAQIAAQKVAGSIIVYDGADDQLPDPTSEAIYGVGNVPAYLGVLSVQFVDFELADYSNNVAATQLTFHVVQEPVVTGTATLIDQLSDGSNPILVNETLWMTRDADRAVFADYLDGAGLVRVGSFMTSDKPVPTLVETVPPDYNGCGVDYELRMSPTNIVDGAARSYRTPILWRSQLAFHIQRVPYTVRHPVDLHIICEGFTQFLVYDGPGTVTFYDPFGAVLGAVGIGSLAAFYLTLGYSVAYPLPPENNLRKFAAYDEDEKVFVYGEGIERPTGGTPVRATWIRTSKGAVFTHMGTTLCALMAREGRGFYVLKEPDTTGFKYRLYVVDTTTGNALGDYAGPTNWTSGISAMDLFQVAGDIVLVIGGNEAARWRPDGTYVAGNLGPYGATLGNVSSSRTLAFTGPDFAVVSYRNPVIPPAVPNRRNFVFTESLVSNARPLREVIREIAAEKGVTNLDFDRLPSSVLQEGYIVTRQTSPRVAIDYLRDLYRVDTAESGPDIKFILRGGSPVRELTRDDLGVHQVPGDPPEPLEWGLADELLLPAEVILKFADRDNNHEVGSVIAKREITESQEVKTLDCTAVSMTGTEAARFCELALQDCRIGSDPLRFSTTYEHELLETGDPIILPGKFKKRRGRMKGKKDRGGMIDWEAVRDEADLLNQYVIGGGAGDGSASTQPAQVPRALVDLLNVPALRKNDVDDGYYAYVYPTRAMGFRGATVYDRAATAPRSIGQVTGAGVRGFATSALANFLGPEIFDEGSHVDVEFPSDPDLFNYTETQIANAQGIYLIGEEIVGVKAATALGGDVWRLHGGMKRGLLGTERARSTHTVGEKVYLLTPSAMVRSHEAGASVSLGAVSVGRPQSDARAASMTPVENTAQATKPLAPVHPRYGFYYEGAIRFAWKRRVNDFDPDPFAARPGGAFVWQTSDTADFAFVRAERWSDGSLAAYDPRERYLDELRSGMPGAFYWRVAERVGTRVGDFSDTLLVPAAAAPVPRNTFFVSTIAADGTMAFFNSTYFFDEALSVTGTPTITSNRIVFDGTDSIDYPVITGSQDTNASLAGFGIAPFEFRFKFKTAASGGVLFAHSDAAFSAGSYRAMLEGLALGSAYEGRLSFYFADFRPGGAAYSWLLQSPVRLDDNVEHEVRIFQSLNTGAGWGMHVDGISVAATGWRNSVGGHFSGTLNIGNDPNLSGAGFVGSIGPYFAANLL